jgi:hypothetical protein
MTTLGEDAEEFFRTGDEGTYEGGPATVIPVTLAEDPTEEHPPLAAVEQQLERRRRFTRVVVTLVGGLGAGVLVLGGWLLARSEGAIEAPGGGAEPGHPQTQIDPPRQAAAAAPPEPVAARVATPPIEPAAAAPVFGPPRVDTSPPTEPLAVRAEKPAPSEPALAKRPARATQRAFATHPNRPLEVHRSGEPDALPKRSAAFAGTVVSASNPGPRNPPTANFPD